MKNTTDNKDGNRSGEEKEFYYNLVTTTLFRPGRSFWDIATLCEQASDRITNWNKDFITSLVEEYNISNYFYVTGSSLHVVTSRCGEHFVTEDVKSRLGVKFEFNTPPVSTDEVSADDVEASAIDANIISSVVSRLALGEFKNTVSIIANLYCNPQARSSQNGPVNVYYHRVKLPLLSFIRDIPISEIINLFNGKRVNEASTKGINNYVDNAVLKSMHTGKAVTDTELCDILAKYYNNAWKVAKEFEKHK